MRALGFKILPSTGKGYAFAIVVPQPRYTAAQQAVIDALAQSLGRQPTPSEIVLALAAHGSDGEPPA